MKKIKFLLILASSLFLIGCLSETTENNMQSGKEMTNSNENEMSFFITSIGVGDGANLGGLEGADSHCANLAESVGVRGKIWRAYLSTSGENSINAIDRIGSGPWFNAKGVLIAENVQDLHNNASKLIKETQLNEKGKVVNGRGDSPNRHDILTGSKSDGTLFVAGTNDTTCSNWENSLNGTGSARVGHHDRIGGGQEPTSWNSAHNSRGCSQENLRSSGGDGLFYCFAID